MENNYEDRKKEVDLGNIDIDSHILQRKKLELEYSYMTKLETEQSMYMKEYSLANNYSDELIRRHMINNVNNDYKTVLKRLAENYEKDLIEIENKYEPKCTKPYYFRWKFIGPVNKYKKIMCGLTYYVKLDEFDKMTVYNDVKYTSLAAEIDYIPGEWEELKPFKIEF